MFRITFDQEANNAYASKSLDDNLTYIRIIETTTNTLFRVRGYVYINDIYENLGAKWNPEWENVCRIYEKGAQINFKIVEQRRDTGGIVIDID